MIFSNINRIILRVPKIYGNEYIGSFAKQIFIKKHIYSSKPISYHTKFGKRKRKSKVFKVLLTSIKIGV
jgi:hypothetical protein